VSAGHVRRQKFLAITLVGDRLIGVTTAEDRDAMRFGERH
jgi:hypothetical protein